MPLYGLFVEQLWKADRTQTLVHSDLGIRGQVRIGHKLGAQRCRCSRLGAGRTPTLFTGVEAGY